MTRYLVEAYAARATGLATTVARARAAAHAMAGEGIPIRHLRAIHLPQDETCFHLFEGPSSEAVVEASRRAGLAFVRIVEALESGPTSRPVRGVRSRDRADVVDPGDGRG